MGGEVFTDWDVLFLLLSICLFIKYRSVFFIMLCLYKRMNTGTLSNPNSSGKVKYIPRKHEGSQQQLEE